MPLRGCEGDVVAVVSGLEERREREDDVESEEEADGEKGVGVVGLSD